MKKKILLLNPPHVVPIMRDTFHPTSKSALYIWHPLDLLIQSGYLRDFEVRLHDGVVDNRTAALDRLLDEFRPDGVLSLVSYPTLKSDLDLLKRIKTKYRSVIFAIGDVTYGEKEVFLEHHGFIDGVLADFTSHAFAQFMKGETVRNAAWRDGPDIRQDWTHEPVDYECPRQDLLDFHSYYLPYWKPPFGSIYASHGCNAKCNFCVVPGWGKPRLREHEAVLEEIEVLGRLGVKKHFFRDPAFNMAPKYMTELCEKIAGKYPGLKLVTWFKPKPLDDAMAKVLKAAGFQYLHIGVETGSPDFLRSIGKDFELGQVAPAVELLHRHGIKAVGHFMAGLPGETEREYRMTADYLKKTKLDVVSFSVFEYSFGIGMKQGETAPIRFDDKKLRRQLLGQLSRFYLRPDRWRGAYFFEDFGHLMTTIPRALKYLFDLRLYPRFKSLMD